MKCRNSMDRNGRINTVKQILFSIEKNMNYIENINDYNKISSFRDFIFSRIFDKLSTLGINYIRILSILDVIRINDCENILTKAELNSKFQDEAEVELIASILRPLFELYLELKSFNLTFAKLNNETDEAIELLLQLVYLGDRFNYDELKLNVSKDFYNCEPLYYKKVSEDNRKTINSFRSQLTQKNLSLLKNTKSKLLDVIKGNSKQERLLLGMDYLTSYAFLSKKNHFSYSNVIVSTLTPKTLLDWSLLLIVGIYRDISKILKFEDNITKTFTDVFNTLNTDLNTENLNNVAIGNIAIFDFGIGKIIGKENQNLKIEYIASNNFEKGVEDVIPKVFMQKEIIENDFNKILRKYYKVPQTLYTDENYEKLYLDLMTFKY